MTYWRLVTGSTQYRNADGGCHPSADDGKVTPSSQEARCYGYQTLSYNGGGSREFKAPSGCLFPSLNISNIKGGYYDAECNGSGKRIGMESNPES